MVRSAASYSTSCALVAMSYCRISILTKQHTLPFSNLRLLLLTGRELYKQLLERNPQGMDHSSEPDTGPAAAENDREKRACKPCRSRKVRHGPL